MADDGTAGGGASAAGEGKEVRLPSGQSVEVKLESGAVFEFTSEPGSGELVLQPDEQAVARCAFCHRSAAETWLMVEGPAGAHICDNCLAFCLATVAVNTGGTVRFGSESADGKRSVSGVELPKGEWETVRRCPACGTYTLSPRDEGPSACAHCALQFPDA